MIDFRKSTVYQIYPKSFYDSNGDGLGDLKGITEKLDYIRDLGVDYIWITPFFVSPQKDNGYDVEDYYSIDPRYGTMEDFDELVREARKRGIRLMLDMVFNHTSSRHQWFRKALAGDEKYKNFYIFRKGKAPGVPPTNWESKFGGSAWEYVEKFDAYYLHLFDVSQPDLNWDNPEVRREIQKVVRFWMDKGVKGFRFDVVNLISKGAFVDDDRGDGRRFYTDGPNIHKYLKELNAETFGRDAEIITVGEMSSTTLENCYQYAGEEKGELSMVFSFHHLKVDFMGNEKWVIVPFDFQKLKDILYEWQTKMAEHRAWNAVFWCNHDQPRVVSRFGNEKKILERICQNAGNCDTLYAWYTIYLSGRRVGNDESGLYPYLPVPGCGKSEPFQDPAGKGNFRGSCLSDPVHPFQGQQPDTHAVDRRGAGRIYGRGTLDPGDGQSYLAERGGGGGRRGFYSQLL